MYLGANDLFNFLNAEMQRFSNGLVERVGYLKQTDVKKPVLKCMRKRDLKYQAFMTRSRLRPHTRCICYIHNSIYTAYVVLGDDFLDL